MKEKTSRVKGFKNRHGHLISTSGRSNALENSPNPSVFPLSMSMISDSLKLTLHCILPMADWLAKSIL